MKTSTRIAAAAAAAALVLGSGGTAFAGSDHGHGHGGSPGGNHGSQAVEHLQKQLTRQLERLGDRLDHATRESRLESLSDEARAAVLANVVADRTALADLATLVAAATTRDELSGLRQQVRAVHPDNYVVIVADLRHASRLSARIAELRATLADPVLLASLDEADVLVGTATDKALAITAMSGRADVRAVRTDLVAAQQIVGAVADGADAR